ncbi:putrescine aminotransferase [bacterium BMS3Abin02]|nr:putrescine aminotransferase [bacterium BMS3Abin02]GBE22509.1 putrescine aminotransferase [bacterium BMS3Bbin01]HDK45581.1 aspartate aminotransferase family protein [Actinomycetota bacterium]HDL48577.1 aspartate aminotransferase family protein [Actinomycetota bacterium]
MSFRQYPTGEATYDAYGTYISPGKVALYRQLELGLVMGSRDGAIFTDAYDGTRLYNCHCNGGVFNLGHRNPRVLGAVRTAMDSFDIGNHHLVSGMRARLAQRLVATTGGALSGVIFGVGGGEVIDLALKAARGVTGRQKIVSAKGGYHGHTGLSVAAGDPEYRAPFGPNLPGFVQVPFDDIDALAAEVDSDTAVVLLEPVPATLGMPIAADGYFASVAELARSRGTLLVLDEVQTGLGRTGTMWCHQQLDVVPDILVTGKGLSGGIYPISATLMSPTVFSFFDDLPFVHLSTFGGAEPGCAAALEVLDIVEAPGFLTRVQELAERFRTGLSDLPFSLRQRGMMMGLAFPAPDAAVMAAKMFFDAGVFAVWAENDRSVLQFLPPLILGDDEAEDIIARVRGIFA